MMFTYYVTREHAKKGSQHPFIRKFLLQRNAHATYSKDLRHKTTFT